jgi:hypothetical protein
MPPYFLGQLLGHASDLDCQTIKIEEFCHAYIGILMKEASKSLSGSALPLLPPVSMFAIIRQTIPHRGNIYN